MREKIKSYLGLAKKAGYLIVGSEKLDGYQKKLYLTLVDKNAGKTSKKIYQSLVERGVCGAEIENLSELVCIENCKLVGIKNLGLSEQIKKYLNQGE